MSKANYQKEEIRHIIETACAKRAALVFVVSDSRVESHFMHLAENDIHVLVPAGKGDALYSLKEKDIKFHFPYESSFLEAPAKILGFGQHEGMRTLMLELPWELHEHDYRRAFRLERIGNVIATIKTPRNETISALLLDISTTGAKLSDKRGKLHGTLKMGDKIELTIPIPNVVTFNSGAITRYIGASATGVEFAPKLAPAILDPLSRWITKKREERGLLDVRADQGGKAIVGLDAQKLSGKADEGKVLVVTSNDEIEATIRKLLPEITFFHSDASVASLKMMLLKKPHLLIMHLSTNYNEKRRLMKSLSSMVPSDTPILLLGTDIDSGALTEMGKELRADSSIAWANRRGVLVQRMAMGIVKKTVMGMVKKRLGHGENPPPKDS